MTVPETVQRTPEEVAETQKYDLMAKMVPYMDKHMILIMLMAQEGGIYKSEDIARAIIQVGMQTSLVDLVEDKYTQLGEEVPAAMGERREVILRDIEERRDQVFDLLEILEDQDKVRRIHEMESIAEMCRQWKVDEDVVERLADYAKANYECGNYQLCAELLKHYRSMPHQGPQSTEPLTPKQISSLWGALASTILQFSEEKDKATELILKLDEHLENSKAPRSMVLLHRTWLLHWSLFAIFSSKNPDPKLLEFFLSEKSMSIISLSCPHLFRYVAAILILQRRLRNLVKETVGIINHEAAKYSDPVTRFLLALYTEMDYDGAQRELQGCQQVCAGDYFLQRHWAEFQEHARLHIFESYCRIHQCINIEMLATKLNMGPEEAELWIVKLIQSAKLDARIDSEKKRVVMTKAPPNVYQQVIEKTKNLAFRSNMLVSNMEKEKGGK